MALHGELLFLEMVSMTNPSLELLLRLFVWLPLTDHHIKEHGIPGVVLGEAQDFEFLTSSQMMLMLLVQEPHFENYW